MKKTLTKVFVVMMCFCVVGALAACSGGSSSDKSVYTVSTEPTYPPFDTTDDNGDVTGFDMDLMKAIAKDQGFEVEFQTLEFDALIPALQSDNTDIVIAGMKATPERQKQVLFSDSYYTTGVFVLVKADNAEITGFDSFVAGKGYKVAVQTGTTCADSAQRLKDAGKIDEVVTLNQVTTALQQLENGDVDAVLVDKPVGAEIQNKQPEKFKMVGEQDPDSIGDFAISVKKGNTELMDKINAGLKNVKEDGTFDKLAKKWNVE